jgi:3-hydroxyacyl-[acyl-carrier-protein] dehydratase
MTEGNKLPMAAEELIPHRPPMQLIKALEGFEEGTGTVSAVVEPGNLLLEEDGSLAEVALLELLAQSYAAVQGYADSFSGLPPRQGFLVGVRGITCLARPRLGDRLQIQVRATTRLEGFAVVEGRVRRDDELLAEGNIKLWIVPVEGGEK